MANVLGALGSVPIMSTIMGMLQSQANLRATQVGTDMEQAKLNLLNQQQQMNNEYRSAVLRGVTLNPAINNPETTSIADTQQNQGMPSSPMGGVLKQLQDERSDVLQSIQLAKLYNQDTKPFYTHLSNIDTNMREAQKDYSKERADRLEQSANMLRDVDSPERLRGALNDIATNVGQAEARALENSLPHDPQTGELLWNESAKKAIAPYASKYLSTKDKMNLNYKESELAINAAKLEEAAREHREQDKSRDRDAAIRREGIAAANKRAQMVMERVGLGMDYKLFKDTQTQISHNADQYKIRDYQKGYEVADRAEAALVDPARGYADVTPPAARALADQFKLMVDNYRSRTGGKYQEAELAKMNGLLQKLDKFTETIGEGDKILAKDVMLQTANEMKKLALDRNADVVKSELKMAKSLKDRGTSPMPLMLYGDVDALVKNNVAKKVTVDGKDYLVFGRKKEDQFEMPSEPERPRILPYETTTE